MNRRTQGSTCCERKSRTTFIIPFHRSIQDYIRGFLFPSLVLLCSFMTKKKKIQVMATSFCARQNHHGFQILMEQSVIFKTILPSEFRMVVIIFKWKMLQLCETPRLFPPLSQIVPGKSCFPSKNINGISVNTRMLFHTLCDSQVPPEFPSINTSNMKGRCMFLHMQCVNTGKPQPIQVLRCL